MKYLILFLLSINSLLGQKMLPFQDNRTLLWGFRDSKNVIIPATYTEVYPYYKGYAWVKVKDAWGVVYETQKNFVLAPTYKEVYPLKNGLYAVTDEKRAVGIADYKGTELQTCRFQHIRFWEALITNYSNVKWDSKSRYMLPLVSWDSLIGQGYSNAALFDLSGTTIKTFDFQHIHTFDNQRYALTYNMNEKGLPIKWGLVGADANTLLSCEYEDIGGASKIMSGFCMTASIFLNPNRFPVQKDENCAEMNIKAEIVKEWQPCK